MELGGLASKTRIAPIDPSVYKLTILMQMTAYSILNFYVIRDMSRILTVSFTAASNKLQTVNTCRYVSNVHMTFKFAPTEIGSHRGQRLNFNGVCIGLYSHSCHHYNIQHQFFTLNVCVHACVILCRQQISYLMTCIGRLCTL